MSKFDDDVCLTLNNEVCSKEATPNLEHARALALALADRISERAEAASGLRSSAASALVVIVNHSGEQTA